MFRSLWIVISTLALANLLALGGILGWLVTNDRINRDRVERLRVMFSSTVSAEAAEAEKLAAEQKAAEEAAKEAAKVGAPPMTAEHKLEEAAVVDDITTQRARRVQRETEDLIKTLMQERLEFERQRTAFQDEVRAFEEMRKRLVADEGSEQFQKTVQLYQSVKAAEAKNMMSSLIRGGKTDQVVLYLNSLPSRNASKIVAEFEKDDPGLAADLLERLRMRGTELAPAPKEGQPTPVAAKPEG